MKQLFLKKEGNSRLLLFFSGWGADDHLFDRPVAEGYDYMLCFDYRNLDFDFTLLDGYREIRLLAWSMGVWAAGRVLAGHDEYSFSLKLAVNGTPYPIHDTKGIPVAIFKGTLDQFSPATLVRFRRRICGTTEQVKEFLSHHPYRPEEELGEELACLWQTAAKEYADSLKWDKAIVGMRDKIYPPVNQYRAWGDTPVCEVDCDHYDAGLFDGLIGGREEIWTKP